MASLPIIFITLITILILLGIYLVINKKEKRPIDFYNLFIIGIVWLGAGVPIGNYGLSAMGIIFMLAGIVNKDKWKANRRRWDDLNDKEKKTKLVIIAIIGVLVLLGFILLYFGQK